MAKMSSVSHPSEIMLIKKQLLLLSVLKTVQFYFRILWWMEKSF